MHNFLDLVCDQLNLHWAWEKVKKACVPGDVWVDEAALASFEVHLGSELESIASDLRSGRYRVAPLNPMAFPKNPDAAGNARVRQYFNFSIRDQVVWTAVVNVVGPYVDARMPAWSYGNRLFRSTWIEEEENGLKRRKIGPYRHSSGRIYRPFQQAWPLFRRHVALAISAATRINGRTANLDQDELDELNLQRSLPADSRCPYVDGEYWSRPFGTGGKNEIYWASVDLEKFYPSVPLSACVDAIVACLPELLKAEAAQVLKMLTQLPLDLSGWTNEELRHIELDDTRRQFHRIPTGLLVSGFLANAALLHVDQIVDRELPKGTVAHFRYVDDHVILATTFEALLSWLELYRGILEAFGNGAHINPVKTEPEALGSLLGTGGNTDQPSINTEQWKKARDSCHLDPEFPVPLMTKTIALVSAIGRTDFTALEDDELGILSHQLEHLLLVDLPETEMPERTRLAFAATRLARIAEARLASPEAITGDSADHVALTDSPAVQSKLEEFNLQDPIAIFTGISSSEALHRLASIADRVFGLVRRVLRERPDRVRLWTHALVIARRLGAAGLERLFSDIDEYSRDPVNRLAASYVLGNSYAVLAAETIKATQILVDHNAAGWRRAASLRFLRNVSAYTNLKKKPEHQPWFVEKSYSQFCVGLYCAERLIYQARLPIPNLGLAFDRKLISHGAELLATHFQPEYRVALAWWGSKFELRKPIRRASDLIVHLGGLVQALPDSDDFWSFFPTDAPAEVLIRLAANQKTARSQRMREGWWFDALHSRLKNAEIREVLELSAPARRVEKIIWKPSTDKLLPLPLWAAQIWGRADTKEGNEWRLGEWTCLEIIRQAANLLASDEVLDLTYLERAKSRATATAVPCAHPINFTLPADLVNAPSMSWQDWRQKFQANGSGVLRFTPRDLRLHDYRYAPLILGHIGPAQNLVRGLGLCLFGLLSRSFLLPVQWNGPGHESVLRHLPQLLREEITYSSATLGILEACLQPRAAENVVANLYQTWTNSFDDDTEHDPIGLLNAKRLAEVIVVAQAELERNQISTFNHRSRQLTPVDLMHLTDADWKSYFGDNEA